MISIKTNEYETNSLSSHRHTWESIDSDQSSENLIELKFFRFSLIIIIIIIIEARSVKWQWATKKEGEK